MNAQLSFADASESANPQVLLVDDDEVNLLLTSIALRERGFEVTAVASGEAALVKLASWTPDIVVLDALMPGLDGFSTCRAIRAMTGFENMPVLMLTGLDDEASITRAYQAGATDFFVKVAQAGQWVLLVGRLHYLLRASRTRLELVRSRAKLARAQDLARMGSFDWRRSEAGLAMSAEGLRVLGFGLNDHLTVRRLLRMVRRDELQELSRLLHGVLRHSSPLTTDLSIVLLDGSERIIHIEAEPEFNDHGHTVGYTGIVQDVTDRRRAEESIRRLANFDALTGLPNRRQINLRAERALEHARRLSHQFALLLIDLDRFKIINDTLGHAAGDELLMEVGRRLRGCVRHSDQVMDGAMEVAGARTHRALEAVGRLGGDEFVALLPEVGDDQDAETVAQRVLQAMREPIFVSGQECFVTASVGVAIYPRDGTTVADLMRNSDVAMYSVKNSGKDASAIYSPQLAGQGREKLELETALHKAIDRQELVLYYQPKVDVRSARMVGAEALMRWQRGDRLVPPGEFIPLAEETGMIVPLSEWALSEAARQARLWQQRFGFAESIAVNLPSRHFARSDLVDHIRMCTAREGVPDRMIMLEITEHNLMEDLQEVMPSLQRLNEIGVEVAIDDFGTGYSSLAYLTMLPISELKIDISFVRELGHKPQARAVIQAIIALARSLGLRVVAEGVETLGQMEMLHRDGCHTMQGYLFSRPTLPDDLERWLESTVLPRKARWIGQAGELELGADGARVAGSRPY